jgi:hypothetical protein
MRYVYKFKLYVLAGAVMALSACADKSGDISILSDSDTFYQSTSINNKIDILWMIDTSGSMQPYQTNLANNFSAFISDFVTKGYDYRMVTAGTDAWVREVDYNHNTCGGNGGSGSTRYYSSADCGYTHARYRDLGYFRDGDIYGTTTTPGIRSGTYLITSLMNPTDVINTFATNVRVGIRGDGYERGFQSLRAVLRRNEDGSAGYNGETHTVLNDFRRNDAFFATIIVADEEDDSRKQNGGSYANTTEYRNAFMNFLDNYTNSSAGNRKYNVSSIVVVDINNCPGHHSGATQGNRYVSIANATDGIVGSICDSNFSDNLSDIANRIVELSTRFKFSREPVPSSIRVFVNNVEIPEHPVNGWTYIVDSGFHYIEFHGTAIPQQGAAIRVDFDPVSLE